jgi:beta-glucosidase
VGKASQMQPGYLIPSSPTSERLEDLLSRMTMDEKLAQLTSYWFHELQDGREFPNAKLRALLTSGIGQISRVGGASTLTPPDVARAGNAIQKFLVSETRLGIPAILHEESCVGYMTLGGTIFPQMIGVASTWDPDLMKQMATEIRRQLLAVGARQTLAPVLDIARDPRWGRTEETFGEDPLLAAQFGVAYIQALQGQDQEPRLMATGKHFVGHSQSAGGLNCAPADLGAHTLWDVYLMPFQAAISDAGLMSMMNAYPELDGDLVAASRTILTDILRSRLGFEGLVVSDYEAILMIHSFHRVAKDRRSAAVMALRAGIDLELPTRVCYGDPLRAALEDGEVSMDEIDLAVRRVLQAKFDLALFEHPYVDEAAVSLAFETPQQRALALEVARRSIVLLKNDGGLLPLTSPNVIAVIGPNADQPRHMLGDYSYPSMLELMTLAPIPRLAFIGQVDEDHVRANSVEIVSILDQIRALAGPDTDVLYAPGCSIAERDRSGFAEAVSVAGQADVVILVLGDKSGLVPSCTSGETRDRAELGLPGVQEELVRSIVAVGKPVVAVLVNGRPLSIPWLHENIPAIVEAWLPGEEGGMAIAEVLFGHTNPGGKLPITFPRSVGQVPLYYSHKPSGGRSHWYGDYVETPSTPLYPFGHGLSYTSFEYSDLRISPKAASSGEDIDISFTLTNTGDVEGDEVVQLYVCQEYASLPRPVKELKGLRRVRLGPQESRRLTFHLSIDALAFYDEALDLVVEAGEVKALIGSSSADIRLQSQFEVSGPAKTVLERRVFGCPVEVGRTRQRHLPSPR